MSTILLLVKATSQRASYLLCIDTYSEKNQGLIGATSLIGTPNYLSIMHSNIDYSMKILFDINHPAHVHLFKNSISWLSENGYEVIVTSRDKDLTTNLLDLEGIPHICVSKASTSIIGNLAELSLRSLKIIQLHMKHKFTLAVGTSASIGHLSVFSRVVSLNFNEDDDSIVPLYAFAAYPFSTKIINPRCVNYTKWPKKRIFHDSLHELAYLHPNNFTPDINVLSKYGLAPQSYVVIRKSSLKAHHDSDAKGIDNNLWDKVLKITGNMEQVLSIEGQKSHQISPEDMHHILAFSKLVFSDSQTVTLEAAVLGVPSIRFNSFVGKISCMNELEEKYKITFGFLPDQETKCLEKLRDILNHEELLSDFQERHINFLNDKIDMNKFIINLIQTELEKPSLIKS